MSAGPDSSPPPRPPRAAGAPNTRPSTMAISSLVKVGGLRPREEMTFSQFFSVGGASDAHNFSVHRLTDRARQRFGDAGLWPGHHRTVRGELHFRRFVAVRDFLVEVQVVFGIQVERHHRRLAVRDQRPRQLLLAEVFRHLDREDRRLTARQEDGRLTVVGPARLDLVVRTDRDLNGLGTIAILVAEDDQVATAVLQFAPSLIGGENRFVRVADRLERQREPRRAEQKS